MGRDLALSVLARLRILDLTDLEELTLPFLVKVVSELIDMIDVELTTEGINEAIRLELVPCKVVVPHVHESGLGHLEINWDSLSLHQKGEVVASIIRVMHLSNLNGVISQEVVDDEGKVVKASVEAEDSSVIVKELLFVIDTATTERLLHVLL